MATRRPSSTTAAARAVTSCCTCITRRAPGAAHIRTASALRKRTAPAARGPARGPATTATGGFISRYEQSDPSTRWLYLATASSCCYSLAWLRSSSPSVVETRTLTDTLAGVYCAELCVCLLERSGCRSPLCSLSPRLPPRLRLRLRRRRISCWTCTNACRCRPSCGTTRTARSSRSSSTSNSMACVHGSCLVHNAIRSACSHIVCFFACVHGVFVS